MTKNPISPAKSRPKLLAGLASLGLILGLAGVVGPDLADQLDVADQELALRDMQRIVDGLRRYSHDTLTLPTGKQGRTDVGWLIGPGVLPVGNPFDALGEGARLESVLLDDSLGGEKWAGPYLEIAPMDPWSRAYLVSVAGLVDGRSTPMVLCAGPNGVCETEATDRVAGGDDILLPIN